MSRYSDMDQGKESEQAKVNIDQIEEMLEEAQTKIMDMLTPKIEEVLQKANEKVEQVQEKLIESLDEIKKSIEDAKGEMDDSNYRIESVVEGQSGLEKSIEELKA